MDRLFLDANVLLSAALKPDSRLAELWHLDDVHVFGSPYVVAEARRNVLDAAAAARLETLVAAMTVLPCEPAEFSIEDDPGLPAKDRPVLLAAIVSSADFLVTGDLTHFGPCFGRAFAGVAVMLPGDHLRAR